MSTPTPDLHSQIMNLPCKIPTIGPFTMPESQASRIREGHKMARHAAAELASKADATISELREALMRLETAASLVALEDNSQANEQANELRSALHYARGITGPIRNANTEL